MISNQGGIRIDNLRKVYGHGDTAVEALKNVNMQVAPGEFDPQVRVKALCSSAWARSSSRRQVG